MDSSPDDTGVFSPLVTTRISTRDQNVHDELRDESESDGTNVFSPDVSLPSRLLKSLKSNDSKENTPPVTQTPPLSQQSAKRKNHLRDIEIENQDAKRKRRFHLSAEESVDSSKNDDTEIFSLGNNVAVSQDENKIKRKKRFVVVSNTPDEDSSNYSDVFAKQISTCDQDFHDESKDAAECDGSNVLSPDASLQSCLVKSSKPNDSEENTQPVTQVPSSSQQSDIDSIFDEFENEEVERKKRFQLSAEKSVDNSKNDTDIFSLGIDAMVSQDTNKIKRKKGFVVATDTLDSSNYSEVFDISKPASQVKKKAERKSRFVSPNLEDSLQLSDIFKSCSKDKKRPHNFTAPKSPVSQERRYSQEFKSVSQDEKKGKRNPRFIPPASSEDNSRYSDIFDCVPKSQNKPKRNRAFAAPTCSQESEDSRYSGVFNSTSIVVGKVKRKTCFVSSNLQESQDDSLGYSDISAAQNKTNEKMRHFASALEDSLHYSDLIVEQDESSIARKRPFVDPASQTSKNGVNYSDLLISKDENNVERRRPFVDPTSQEINDHLNYTDVISKNDNTECAANQTAQYSALYENSHDNDQPKSEKSSGSNFTSVRSICIDTIRSSFNVSLLPSNAESLHYSDVTISNNEGSKSAADKSNEYSASCENSRDNNQRKCEKSNGSDFMSVRSICIDTIRSSCDVSLPPSSTDVTDKPFNFTYDVLTSAFCQRENVSTSVNIDFPNKNDIGSPKSVPIISPVNLTYDVSTSAFNQRENVSLSANINLPKVNESQNNSALNLSDERTLVSSNSLEEADQSNTLIESDAQESAPITDESANENDSSQKFSLMVEESKDGSASALESYSVTNESENKNTSTLESGLAINESENKTASALESSSLADKSENETDIAQESIPVTDKSENECIPSHELVNTLCPAENSKNQCDKIPESYVDPAILTQSIMMDTISNSSNVPPSNEKIVEESVYVAFNPSSLMLSVTELVDASPDNHAPRDVSVAENKSTQSVDRLNLPSDGQSDELPITVPSSTLPSAEENIKDHDYAMAHVSNMEETVENPVAKIVEESLEKSVTVEIPSSHVAEIAKEPVQASTDDPCAAEIPRESNVEEVTHTSSVEKVPAEATKEFISAEVIIKESTKTSADIQSPEETSKKQASPNASSQSVNYSLRSRKSLPEQQPSVTVENLDKIPSPKSATSVNQSREKSISSNNSLQKSNRSMRSKNSHSASIQSGEKSIASNDYSQKSTQSLRSKRSRNSQKTQESVPSTSAAAINNVQMNDTDGGLFNDSNPVSGIASENFTVTSSRTENYSSRSRNSTSSNTQTFASRSSVSVFSISKIGRPSSAPHEFKVPEVPKVLPKKKKKSDQSFKHLPSRPNFPKFDFYCNTRFYDYLTIKMQSKFGIRTNNEAVKLARYISEVVREVIAMQTGDHHILVEEMKKVLFRKNIVTTHYNFYMFCMDYMPPWFRRKAVPMMRPVDCPPNVTFNLQNLFDLIE